MVSRMYGPKQSLIDGTWKTHRSSDEMIGGAQSQPTTGVQRMALVYRR